ncbi:MAG TPA: peptidoglycan DD-metalloendopeptidase family protein [Candidatus Tectomicrobia bacterium]|jgi:murein DD-endopeptidase MepM/ murein hydrolase activator NlpD
MEQIPAAAQTYTLHQDLGLRATRLQQRLAAHAPGPDGPGQELQEGVAEFASLFIFQMLQVMRRTIPQSGLLDKGFAHELYTSLFDQEIARQLARREDLGLTSLLLRQFREQGTDAPPPIPRKASLEAYKQPGKASIELYKQQMPPGPDAFALPANGFLSSHFGWRHDPFDQETKWHNGIDIATAAGSVVRAAAPGIVAFSGSRPGYGNLLIIEHQNGYQTYYGHNAENLVLSGAQVKGGQPIARVGQTGRATGPHVHFELRKDGQALDPTIFLRSGGLPAAQGS